MKRLVFGLALLLLALVLFAAFSWPGAGVPWSPARSIAASPAAWQSAATLRIDGDGVVAEGADANGTTMLLQPVEANDAAAWRYLHYDVQLAPSDKLFLLWRSGGQLRTAALPDAAGGDGTVDLRGVEGWSGPVEAIGVAAVPTDVLHPAFVAAREFTVRGLRLESASWRGALAARWNDWTATRPWTGRSNNTGGFEFGPVAGASLTAYIALLTVGGFLLAFACFGRDRARTMLLPTIGVAVALLAIVQFQQLLHRGAVAHEAKQLAASDDRYPLAAQPALAAAARAWSMQASAGDIGRTRMFVAGETQFLGEYATWLLRDHNAALLATPDSLPATSSEPAYIVLAGRGDWQFDVAAGRLSHGERHWLATLVYDGGVLRAYRLAASETGP